MGIEAKIYGSIFIVVVSLIYAIITPSYLSFSESRVISRNRQPAYKSIWLLIIVILFIGFRPISGIFVDMVGYADWFNRCSIISEFRLQLDTENIIFDNYISYLAYCNINIHLFFVSIATIYFGGMWLACRRWFPNDTLFAFLIFLGAFSTFSYATNGIKSGAATSIFLVALAYRDKIWLSLFLALLSWGFHHSMHAVIISYIIVLFFKNSKWYLFLWGLCIILSFFKFDFLVEFLADNTDEKGRVYLMEAGMEAWGGKTGFRFDFFVYSASAVFIGYWALFKKKIKSAYYRMIYNLYLTVNGLWVICMYVPFTNRIAYLSWFMLPVVVIYPFLKCRIGSQQYAKITKIGWIYMAFSLFMTLIYYSI